MIRLQRVAGFAEPPLALFADLAGGQPIEAAAAAPAATQSIIAEYSDPLLELVRLLHEAAEIEHSLMVQYLYAAFSLKPRYAALYGGNFGAPDALLGVAIQEMQHLSAVNRFLGQLGAPPHLGRQDFPYEPEIYPFPMNLEPLSRYSVAKYVFTEAPANVLEPGGGQDPAFLELLFAHLGPGAKPNHVGSLYSRLISLVDVLQSSPGQTGLPDLAAMKAALEGIRDEGENDHFPFFRSVFLGTHPDLTPATWELDPVDPDYPAFPCPTDPSALLGHERQIQNPRHLRLARFGNMIYWIVLAQLDTALRFSGAGVLKNDAIGLMQDVLGPIGQTLASQGSGLPFDLPTLGSVLGSDLPSAKRWIARIVDEASAMGTGGGAPFAQYLPALAAVRAHL